MLFIQTPNCVVPRQLAIRELISTWANSTWCRLLELTSGIITYVLCSRDQAGHCIRDLRYIYVCELNLWSVQHPCRHKYLRLPGWLLLGTITVWWLPVAIYFAVWSEEEHVKYNMEITWAYQELHERCAAIQCLHGRAWPRSHHHGGRIAYWQPSWKLHN